ncbi:MAG: gamma-glutamyltransferase family protein [Paraperlucidibaca sp.]
MRRLPVLGILAFTGLMLSACSNLPSQPSAAKAPQNTAAVLAANTLRQATPEAGTGRYPLSTAIAAKAMVVTAHPLATQAALTILLAGGSAADAAIAAQAVLGLVEPQSSGFGGGGFLVLAEPLRNQTARVTAIDGRETAPSVATENRFLRADGQPMAFDEALANARAVGVPGVVAMLDQAHRRWGKLPWRTLLAPAIEAARKGVPVSHRLNQLAASDPLLAKSPTLAPLLLDRSGKAWPVGYVLKNIAYAEFLEALAKEGPEAFYRGKIAKQFVRELRAAGSDISASDWASYSAEVTPALCLPIATFSACSAPAPSGGFSVLEMVGLWQRHQQKQRETTLNASRSDLSTSALHGLLEAERLGFADRQRYGADPRWVGVPVQGLLSPRYLTQRAGLIGELAAQGQVPAGEPAGAQLSATDRQIREMGTSHISIVDTQGRWLAMTSSIEDRFGSRLLVRGVLMNNQLTDFSFMPKQQNLAVANRVGPAKRPRSAMSPTLLIDANGKPMMALGSPGGSRILGFNARILSAYIAGIRDADALVSLPMALNRNGPTEVESTLPKESIAELKARGHDVKVVDMASGHGVIVRRGSTLQGAADPRREGQAAGF